MFPSVALTAPFVWVTLTIARPFAWLAEAIVKSSASSASFIDLATEPAVESLPFKVSIALAFAEILEATVLVVSKPVPKIASIESPKSLTALAIDPEVVLSPSIISRRPSRASKAASIDAGSKLVSNFLPWV